jgi:hypothetical protein
MKHFTTSRSALGFAQVDIIGKQNGSVIVADIETGKTALAAPQELIVVFGRVRKPAVSGVPEIADIKSYSSQESEP